MEQPVRPHLQIHARAELQARAALLARLQTVQLLRLSEKQIAEMIRDTETDPIFEELFHPGQGKWKVIRFQPNPRTRLSASFYEMNEEVLSRGGRPEAARVIAEGKEAVATIQKIGQENFVAFFLRGDQVADRAEVARLLQVTESEVQGVRDFLLTYSIQSEFFDPSNQSLSAPGKRVVRLAHLSLNEEGEAVFEFGSPLLARGRYDIQYDHLQRWLREGGLTPQQRRHLKAFVRRLELINWRQNTLYRILDFVCHSQRFYLASRDSSKKIPITQRQLSKSLAVAPSTVNRAIQGRSLVLPWGEEVLLEDLFCSRKNLCLGVLKTLGDEDSTFANRTDMDLRERLQAQLGFSVPRRTINNYRRLIERKKT